MTSALVASSALEQAWPYFDLAAHNERQRKLRHALTRKLQAALARETALRQENAALLKQQHERAAEIEHRLFELTHRLQGLCDDLGPMLFAHATAGEGAPGGLAAAHAVPIGPIVAEILTSAADALQQAQALADGCRDGVVAG